MPKCDICGEEEDKLMKCKKCGNMFCEWCGSSEDTLCIDCMEDDEDNEDWDDDDDEDEDEPEN